MSYELEKYKLQELRKIADKLGLPARRSKQQMIDDISGAFKEYEEYKEDKLDRYRKLRQLGQKGKEGTTYLVVDTNNKEYAMKTFRSKKSSTTMEREYQLQKKASEVNVAPKVYGLDTVSKYIVMEKMDEHFHDVITKQGGVVYKYQQQRIIQIYKELDKAKVFHGDANICNYMMKGKEIFLIDYGFAKEITPKLCKQIGSDRPNMELMLLGIILKFKEMKLPEQSYSYLREKLSKNLIEKFGL